MELHSPRRNNRLILAEVRLRMSLADACEGDSVFEGLQNQRGDHPSADVQQAV